jgi:ADP-ribose pyrophosphatase
MNFTLRSTEIIYPGRAFTIRRDTLGLPDGRETRLDIVEHVGSVVLLPIDELGRLLFVRQYRHAAGKEMLELPAGTLDEGEPPMDCARRELREETGMDAGCLEQLGGFYLAPGYSTEYMTVFLATNLHPAPLPPDEDEFLALQPVPLEDAWDMVDSGDLPDAKSLAALALARKHIQTRG